MKKQKLKLGILFNFQSSWMGGIIYIVNIVKTLNFLDDEEKPQITLFYKPELSRFLNEFDDYPYLKKVEYDYPDLIKGNIKSLLLRKNIFINDILKQYDLDVIYPAQDFPVRTKSNVKLVSWFADFQYRYYPEFFTKMQLMGRIKRVKLTIKNADHLVLSSNDAYNDLKKFNKVRDGLKIYVYHFVSIIDDLQSVNVDELKAKYDLPEKYFMVSNQFHKHKNHRILLLALAKLKKEGIRIHFAMTGKMPEASHSLYMAELHGIIEDNRLQDQISMLGVIPRNDQLQLMRHSQAVIQPSYFEGWSTVIEDARSLQAPVIASSLRVNIEQLGDDHGYFDPDNVDELVAILKDYPERNMEDKLYDDYELRVKEAARILMVIFKPE